VDHVIPRRLVKRKRRPKWLATINAPENLVPACDCCNGSKGGQDVRYFLRHDPARLERIVRSMARINPSAAALMEASDAR
jgi:5-methylcytosine-specific restriction endonuclease McrA